MHLLLCNNAIPKWKIFIVCIGQLFELFKISKNDQLLLINSSLYFLRNQFQVKKKYYKEINALYNKNKFYYNLNDLPYDLSQEFEVYNTKVSFVVKEISLILKKIDVTAKRRIISSYIHMTGNRIFTDNNLFQELIAYEMLQKQIKYRKYSKY